jgi:3',5'-cyclic AMP phosphodiesterase CpdA
MIIAHISDFHIVEPGMTFSGRVDTAAGLHRAVQAINALDPLPDLVVATGDLVNDGTAAQYRHLEELLAPLVPPMLAIPGNHDERSIFTALFGARRIAAATANANGAVPELIGTGPRDTTFVTRFNDIITIGLDTTVEGRHDGRLGAEQLEWLDETLTDHAGQPVVIVQHHPPFATGIEQMDEMGLGDAAEQREVLSHHVNVNGVLCGHLHRFITAAVGSGVAVCAPSTGAQLALQIGSLHPAYTDETPALLLHLVERPERLVSHVHPIPTPSPWLPEWAR